VIDLLFLTIDKFFQKSACCFVFDCLNGTTCFPFKDYFQRLHRNASETLETMGTWENSKTFKGQTSFACRSFFFKLGAYIFNLLPLSLRNINFRVLFRKALDD